jgi:hypothetical protein
MVQTSRLAIAWASKPAPSGPKEANKGKKSPHNLCLPLSHVLGFLVATDRIRTSLIISTTDLAIPTSHLLATTARVPH